MATVIILGLGIIGFLILALLGPLLFAGGSGIGAPGTRQ